MTSGFTLEERRDKASLGGRTLRQLSSSMSERSSETFRLKPARSYDRAEQDGRTDCARDERAVGRESLRQVVPAEIRALFPE